MPILSAHQLQGLATVAQAPKRVATPVELRYVLSVPEPMRVYSPGDAARELGVTTQSLRRYAQYYAEVFEPVTQHAKQRVFTDEVVTRLQAAQALQHANRAPSIKAALELIRDGLADADTLAESQEKPDPMLVLVETVQALRDEIVLLRGVVEAQGEQLQALPAPVENDKAAYIAELEQLHAELEKRNAYLEGELKRRDEQAKPKPRGLFPWLRRGA